MVTTGQYRIEIVETPDRLWTWIVHCAGSVMYTAPAASTTPAEAEADALAYVYVKHPGIAFEIEHHPADPD